METIKEAQDSTATFIHNFFGRMKAEARYHINPDGSRGGIVAATAKIGAGVKIAETAQVGYGASAGDDDRWITVGPQGSRNTILTAVCSKDHGLRWWVGCQRGITSKEFRNQIADTHGDNDHAQDYLALIVFVESHPGLARWHKANPGAMA